MMRSTEGSLTGARLLRYSCRSRAVISALLIFAWFIPKATDARPAVKIKSLRFMLFGYEDIEIVRKFKDFFEHCNCVLNIPVFSLSRFSLTLKISPLLTISGEAVSWYTFLPGAMPPVINISPFQGVELLINSKF